MVLKPEDYERLKKNVTAMNNGAARLGEQVQRAHERHESPAMERAENLKPANDMVRRFYPNGRKP